MDEAKLKVARMLQNNGKRPTQDDKPLTDEEFEAIQKTHFDKKSDAACRNAIEMSAFWLH